MPKRNELKLTKRAVDALAAIRSPKPGRVRRLAAACVFLLAAVAFSVSAEAAAGDATGAPVIAGEPVVGKTITAETGSNWIGDPDGLPTSFTYQWIRENPDGSNSANITSATSSTYTLTTADATKKIKVKVSFTDNGTNDEELTSIAFPQQGLNILPATRTAATCAAPNLTGRGLGQIAATLTVGVYAIESDVTYGWFSRKNNTVILGGVPTNRRAFRIYRNNNVVRFGLVTLAVTSGSTTPRLDIVLERTLTADERADLQMHVCDRTFNFSDAVPTEHSNNTRYSWPRLSNYDWATHPTRMLHWSFRLPSDDATLSALTTSEGTLTPAFNSGTTSYAATVGSSVSQITVAPTENDSGATVAYLDGDDQELTDADTSADDFQVDLSTGANVVKVKVTAENGTTEKVYTLTITRQSASVATLSALTTSGVTLTPAFNSGTTSYAATVGSGVSQITVRPTKSDPSAAASYLDGNDQSLIDADTSADDFQVDLSTGVNVVKVKVMSADDTTTNTYTLTITRRSASDATLSALTTSEGTLTPAFNSGTTSYAATVGNGVSSVTLTLTKNDSSATIDYLAEDDTPLADADANADGFQVALSIGANVVKVKVTSADTNTTNAYTLTITRQSTDATLSALAISEGTLTPAFNSGTTSYAATVGNGVSSVTLTLTKNDSSATIDYLAEDDTPLADADANADGFQVALSIGANVVKVKVTAQDTTTTNAYTLTITRQSTDATLSALAISEGTLTPAFNSGTTSYAATVGNGVSSVTLTLTKNDSSATIDYLAEDDTPLADADANADGFQVALSIGANVVKVKVTAQDTTTTNAYTLTITRQSTDATLSALAISEGTLTPAFNSGTTSYAATVGNGVSSVTLTLTKNDSSATIDYLAEDDTPLADADANADGFQVDLSTGANVVKVKVTAQDTTTTNAYTLTITRQSTDATLSALAISEETLTPDFVSATLEYSATVGNGVSSVTLTLTKNDSNATIEYLTADDSPLTDADGNADDFQVALSIGANVVKVKVTAQDTTTTNAYTLTITRQSADATLSALAISEGTLTPDFVPATKEYSATVGNGVSSVTLTLTKNDSNATIEYLAADDSLLADADASADDFQVDLSTGANVVKVKVTAQDPTTTRTYTVTVTRQTPAANDATLSALAIREGTLTPDFVPATTEYSATVGNGVSSVTLTLTKNDSNATIEYLAADDSPLTDADGNADGFQVNLSTDENVVKVRVTTMDGNTQTYTVTVTRLEAPADPGLIVILNEGEREISLPFDPARTSYTVTLDEDVSRVTVGVTPSASNVIVEYLDVNDEPLTDADQNTPGTFEFDLEVGVNVVKVKVTTPVPNDLARSVGGPAIVAAEDGARTTIYVLTLIRGGGAPSAPTDLTAQAEGSSVIVLTWGAPADVGGSAITGYRIEVSTDGTEWSEIAADTGVLDTTYRHTGLFGGTTNHYRVSAINSAGVGAASSAATATTAPGPPGAPRNLRGAGGGESVTLTWSAPASDGGSPVTGYEYQVDQGEWMRASSALTATATDLVNGQAYEFRVRAVNAHGAGEAARVTATAGPFDRIARAWLARFSREAASHVSGAIEERLRGAPSGVVFGGQSLWMDGKASGRPNAEAAGTAAFPRAWGDSALAGGGMTTGSALGLHTGEDVSPSWRELRISEALLASWFHLTSAEEVDSGSRWSFWGRGTRSNFEGKDGELGIEGDVTTATLGVDYERERWLVGVALARSAGEGEFRLAGGEADEIESATTGIYPYTRYRVSKRLTLWAAVGRAQGDLTMKPGGGAVELKTDIETVLAAGGARGVLLPAQRAGGFEAALRADFLLTTATSEAAAGLPGIDADTNRIRLLLEGSRSFRAGTGVLTPSVEVGLRNDGGDAETGGGFEVGGSLRYATERLSVEVSARGLIAHAESDYEEWGVSGSVRIGPHERGRGLSMRLGSAFGADSGGAERVWSGAPGGFSSGSFDPGARLEAEVGYGLDAPRGLLTPYAGLAVSENAETWRAGARWESGSAFDVSLEVSLKESANADRPESGVLLRGSIRW